MTVSIVGTGSGLGPAAPGAMVPGHGDGARPVEEAERRARASWSRIAEPGDADATRLLARYGPVAALEVVRGGRDAAAPRFAGRLEQLDVDRDLHIAAMLGARVVCPGEAEWPAALDVLELSGSVPYCLWVRGPADLSRATARSAAVVGARSSTAYGDSVASDLAAGLADRGFTVVSGAAFGIDAAAHRGCLAVNGTTVAVLAGGVERPYPAAHTGLIGEIARTGAVLSEVPPGSAPTRRRFLQRNRLIATLTRGTVVVEAGLRSGSLNTARTADDHGRLVGAVPGPVTSVVSAGCHELIRAGRATLVTDAAEAAELLGAYGSDIAPVRRAGPTPTGDLDDDELRVVSALPVSRGAPLAKVALAAGDSVTSVLGTLGRLELGGLAERHGEGWRLGATLRTRHRA